MPRCVRSTPTASLRVARTNRVIPVRYGDTMSATHNPCYTVPVANLTLAIDEDLLRRARIRALEEGTSVNAVVRAHLAAYADSESPHHAMQRFLEIADRHPDTGRTSGERTWTRSDLYDDRRRS